MALQVGNLLPQNGEMTKYLVGVNIFLYVAMALFNIQNIRGGGFMNMAGTTLFLFGAKEPSYIANGEWWRLITAGFLHGGVMHIFMNMWGLLNLGQEVEEAFGTGRYLVIYLGSSVIGFVASWLFSPALSIGASAGIFGLVGAMIAYGVTQRGSLGRYIKSAYLNSAILALVLSAFLGFGQTDNWAHIGGVLGGFGVAYLVGQPVWSAARLERYWNIAGLGTIALTVIAFVIQLVSALHILSQ